MKFFSRIVVLAVALWLTTLVMGGADSTAIQIVPFEDTTFGYVATLVVIAVVFALVNTLIGPFIRIVSIPLYILTLGLFGLIINGALLMLTAWVTGLLGFGLVVSGFWPGVLAALIMSIISAILSALLRVGVNH